MIYESNPDWQCINRINSDGTITSIPLDTANSDYAQYLAYTAWVEAGNAPEDFWTQNNV